MRTYVGKKNYCWIWIAVDRLGQRFISFVCGAGSTKTGIRLYEQIKNISVSKYCSDCWNSYEEFIPTQKHVQTKAETYTIDILV